MNNTYSIKPAEPTKPKPKADLARETGLKIERIYQLNRELKDIYPSIKKQLRQERGVCQ